MGFEGKEEVNEDGRDSERTVVSWPASDEDFPSLRWGMKSINFVFARCC